MLYDWMKSLIFYLLFASIVTHIIPSKQYKQYVRYFIGLVVIILLASPVRFLFELGSGDLQELLAEMELLESGGTSEYVGGSIYDYYSMGIREGLLQALKEYPVEDVSVITDTEGTVLQCRVYVSKAESRDYETEIKNVISDVYNLEHARIYVVRR